jgi:hypothetical protein
MTASELAQVRSVRVGFKRLKAELRGRRAMFLAFAVAALALAASFFGAVGALATPGVAPVSAPHAGSLVAHAAPVAAVTAASNVTGPSIFNDIWNLFSGFIQIVLTGLGNAFSTVFSAFAQGIAQMFQGWGFSLGQYGIWGPMMVVVSLGVAAVVAYMMLDGIGVEKVILEGEDSL